ncbi:MAG: radical SAM protein [Clostridia bacterium]|nr:radical SAM protein [Clostridia bacterium]
MTITYQYKTSLYINITNRCSNRCDFCIRTNADGFYSKDLWLKREPTREEIISAIKEADPNKYDSLVFCGYGEPTERLDDMLYVCRQIKAEYDVPIRLNTNGQSDLINLRSTASEFEGAIDKISISLNSPTAEGYQDVCHSIFGKEAFDAIIKFATEVKSFVPSVVFSVVKDTIPDSDIEKCREIAERCGVPLRVRSYIQNK